MKCLNILKKLAASILTVSFLGALSSFPVFANGGYTVATINKGKKEYNQFPIVYSDDFFEKEATEYNDQLAAASLALEMSSFSASFGSLRDEHQKPKFRNVFDALEKLGFGEIEANKEYDEDSTPDSIGVAVGNKKIQNQNVNYTLIPIVVRGGGYDSEWAGNMKIGACGDFHQGFNLAADKVKDFVDKYISRKKITGCVKLWIVGYSRAGAVAGLVAYKYNNKYNSYNNDKSESGSIQLVPEKDIYAYTFEAPNSIFKSDGDNFVVQEQDNGWNFINNRDSNIHNIVDNRDLVTMVAPSEWGFTKPGVIHNVNLNDEQKKNKKLIVDKYVANMECNCNEKNLVKSKKNVREKDELSNAFVSALNGQQNYTQAAQDAIKFLNNAIKDKAALAGKDVRAYYAENLQSTFVKILSILSKNYSKDFDKFLTNFKSDKRISYLLNDKTWADYLKKRVAIFENFAGNGKSEEIFGCFVEHFNEVFSKKLNITNDEKGKLLEFFNSCLNKVENLPYLGFLICNGKEILRKHEPALHLASLISSIADKDVYDAYINKLGLMQKDYSENGKNAQIERDFNECALISELLTNENENLKEISGMILNKIGLVGDKDENNKIEALDEKINIYFDRYKKSLESLNNRIKAMGEMKDETDEEEKKARTKILESIEKFSEKESLLKIAKFKVYFENFVNRENANETQNVNGIKNVYECGEFCDLEIEHINRFFEPTSVEKASDVSGGTLGGVKRGAARFAGFLFRGIGNILIKPAMPLAKPVLNGSIGVLGSFYNGFKFVSNYLIPSSSK